MNQIQIKKYNLTSEFLLENESLLLKRESLNNLMLGLANRLKILPPAEDDPVLLYSIWDNGRNIGQAIRTNFDKPLIISSLPEFTILELVTYLKDNKIKLFGVIGESLSAELFTKYWGDKSSLTIHLGIY